MSNYISVKECSFFHSWDDWICFWRVFASQTAIFRTGSSKDGSDENKEDSRHPGARQRRFCIGDSSCCGTIKPSVLPGPFSPSPFYHPSFSVAPLVVDSFHGQLIPWPAVLCVASSLFSLLFTWPLVCSFHVCLASYTKAPRSII